MAKVNCCRDQQLPWSLWLGLQASWSHQTWHGHGQGMGLGVAVVRLVVPYQGSAGADMIYRQVSVKWPKSIAVETSSCLGRSGSACRQAGATKLGMSMARGRV